MKRRDHTPSSGKVFADLGLPKADDPVVKDELAANKSRLQAAWGG